MILYRPIAFGLLILMSCLGIHACHTDEQRRPPTTADRQKHAKEFRNEDDWIGAYRAVQETIRRELDSPVGIQFPWDGSASIRRDSSSQRYLVRSHYMKGSGRGDTLKVPFRAYAFQYQDDRWEVYNLVIDKPR